jgi:anionic cell wall polymer biosynthesis LytR-Cps2A-Psr (LCP) family protein
LRTFAPPAPRRPRRPSVPKPNDPLWAKLCLIFGALVMVASGTVVAVPKLVANWATGDIPRADIIPEGQLNQSIDGPINLLLLGMDERKGNEAEGAIRADTIIIVHIPSSHDKVYMVSLPRDLEVAIPDYPKTNFRGWRTKINAAFAAGAKTPDGKPDGSLKGRQQGAELTMMTINGLVPGGLKFNGAAIINFDGFLNILKALGGVEMCVDEETRSIHFDKNGKYSYAEVPYARRKIYPVGCYAMADWEALDFARQRHFDDGDYVRQRHQQQLIMAIVDKVASSGTLTDLGRLKALQEAAGDLLTLDLGATSVEDWGFTLRSLKPSDVVAIKTNGGNVTPIGNGNEQLTAESQQLLKAVHDDTVFDFLAKHPDWIVQKSGPAS